MADLITEKKKQKRLIIILLSVLVITVFVLWYGFLRQKPSLDLPADQGLAPVVSGFEKLVEIDLKFLEGSVLKELRPFEEIKQFEGSSGRQNPFIPF